MLNFKKIQITQSIILAALILFRLTLDVGFLFYLDVLFNHAGFVLNFSFFDYSLSWFGLISLFFLLPIQNHKISEIAVQFMFVMIYVPFSSYFGLSEASVEWFFLFSGFWLIIAVLLKIPFSFRTPKIPIYFSNQILFFITGFTVLIVFIILFSYVDFRLNFDLYAVYQIRAENPTSQIPFSGYYLNWTAKVFLPFLLLYSVIKIKPSLNFYTILFSILIFVLFSVTGHKAYLFVIPMLVGTVVLLRTQSFYFYLTISLTAVSLLGLMFFLIFNSDTIITLVTRRTLLLPAQISFYYFDFFDNRPLLLSNSILSNFYPYPYEMEPSYIIGDKYYNRPEMSVNNGIISDAFMQFGRVGLLFWAIILIVVLKLLDSFVKGKNNLILWPLVLVGIKSFVDGAMFTSLLTHGFLVMMILCLLYPKLKTKTA